MFPLSSSMAALLQQHQLQQQASQALSPSHNSSDMITSDALKEEVGRRKASMAGTPYSITKQFPWRLHEMLDLVEEEGLEEIVSFLPDGRSFKVHDPPRFEQGLMRRCFNQTRYKSFQRQLNLWGFERKNDAVYNIKGTYSHPWFIRGRKDLTPLIARVGGAGNKFKQTNVDMNDGPSKELEKIAAEQQPVPPKNALDKKDTSMPPTEVYVPTSASKDIADHKTLSAAGFSRSAMPSSLTSMSGLYSKFMGGKTQSAVNPNMAAFLDTFQSKTPVSEAEGGTGKNLGSVISALNRAEAIGKMSAPGAPSESSSTGQDLMRRLQQQQRASSISRSRLLDEAMRITTSSDISSSANARSATPVSVANSAAGSQDDLLQHYLRRQQQRQQDSNAMIAAAMREMAQKQAVEQLLANNRAASAGGGESGPASGINSHILHRLLQQQPSSGLGGSAGGGGSGTDFLLEKLRLEESIHALMRERVRLEAAAILEERERRRLEALVNASS